MKHLRVEMCALMPPNKLNRFELNSTEINEISNEEDEDEAGESRGA